MNLNKLCMGCMEEKEEDKVCPKCGWVEGTQAESVLHLQPRTILKNQYIIGRVLGHGGFGITYLAYDIKLGSKLAIKEYFPQGMATRGEGNPTISVYSGNFKESFQYGLDKFLEEARTLAKFDDIPEIVTVKDFFEENGTAYLVMSYIQGITLKQYLEQKGGKLPLDTVLNIILPIMKALEQVHMAGMLHRDISPDNIYITKNFNIKLLDFGAARFAIGEQSKSLSVILKPGYAPEEQYRSRGNQGTWTDVYAVGATMYRSLTGEIPPEALDRLEEDTIKKPSELEVIIDKNIEAALMKSLSVKASGRYQNISEFRSAVFDGIPSDDVEEKKQQKKEQSKEKLDKTEKAEKTDYKSRENFKHETESIVQNTGAEKQVKYKKLILIVTFAVLSVIIYKLIFAPLFIQRMIYGNMHVYQFLLNMEFFSSNAAGIVLGPLFGAVSQVVSFIIIVLMNGAKGGQFMGTVNTMSILVSLTLPSLIIGMIYKHVKKKNFLVLYLTIYIGNLLTWWVNFCILMQFDFSAIRKYFHLQTRIVTTLISSAIFLIIFLGIKKLSSTFARVNSAR